MSQSYKYILVIINILFSSGEVTFPANYRAREAPFCIDVLHPQLENFRTIIASHSDNREVYTKTNPKSSPKGLITTIELTRIRLADINPNNVASNLLQWFHMTIKANEKLEGLYIQSLGGPLGLPFGRFVTDFNCQDCAVGVSDYDADLVPCLYRPRTATVHPNVYVIGGDKRKKYPALAKGTEFHVHFTWTESLCAETPFMQFLIIAVKEFPQPQIPRSDGEGDNIGDFETFFSPVYDNIQLESESTLPSPVYLGFNTYFCHLQNVSEKPLKIKAIRGQGIENIIVNRDYDFCVATRRGVQGECPPGPFRCRDPPKDYEMWIKLRKKRALQWTDQCVSKCNKTTQKPAMQSNKPPIKDQGIVVNNQTTKNITTENITVFYKHAKNWTDTIFKLHGLIMIFCWTFSLTLGIYFSRFFKEAVSISHRTGCFSLGCWLWTHISLMHVCLMTMWGALFLVVFNNAELCEKQAARGMCMGAISAHKTLGGLAMIVFHCNFFLGFYHPLDPAKRNLCIFFHAIFGYMTKLFAFICILTSSVGNQLEIVGMILLAEVLSIGIGVIATIVQCSMDSALRITPPRAYFPIQEAIEVLTRVPCETFRTALTFVEVMSEIIIFAVLSYFYYHSPNPVY